MRGIQLRGGEPMISRPNLGIQAVHFDLKGLLRVPKPFQKGKKGLLTYS